MQKSNTAIEATVLSLPYMKHFKGDNKLITNDSDQFKRFKRGEKSMYNILRFILIGGLAAAFIYFLPAIFVALGQMIAIAAVLSIISILITLRGVIFKGVRLLGNQLNKYIITQDPFLELRTQESKLISESQTFDKARGKIRKSRDDMRVYASEAENKAKRAQNNVKVMQDQFKTLKSRQEVLKSKSKKTPQEQEEYITIHAELLKLKANIERTTSTLRQQKDFVRRYGMGAKSMQDLDTKLTMAKAHMEIKLLDLQDSIRILEREYEYAANAKEATSAAEGVLGFEKKWEVEFALNVVTNQIAEDIASTSASLSNIDRMLDGKFDMNDDVFLLELDDFVKDLETPEGEIPMATDYDSPDFKPTREDKINSGFGGDLF